MSVGAYTAANFATRLDSPWPINLLAGGLMAAAVAMTLAQSTLVARVAVERQTVHIPDALADPEYEFHGAQRLGRFRTILGVPLLREGVQIGVISLGRTVVKPFTDRQGKPITMASGLTWAIPKGAKNACMEPPSPRLNPVSRAKISLYAP